jgi:hypothetical protein
MVVWGAIYARQAPSLSAEDQLLTFAHALIVEPG